MHRKLRFCMITTFYPPYSFGGDGIFVQRLSHELADRGHEVEIIHCVDSFNLKARGAREPASRLVDHPNVTVHALRSGFGALSPLATQQTGRPLFKASRIREILNRGFDVIHYHNVSLVGGPGVLGYGSGIKLYTLHEYWLVCPTHLLFKFNREPCESRQCFACSLVHMRPPQWWRYGNLLETAVKNIDAFIAPSRFSIEQHRKMGFDAPFFHIPVFAPRRAAFASPPAAGKRETEAAGSDDYFLFVGRLEKIKGLQTLLPTFSRPGVPKLLVAGAGDYEPHLREAARGANVVFLGKVSEDRLQGLYRNAVALIVPSVCYEVFPLVALEAFSQQTPVIVRDLGGMAEVAEDSGGGISYNSDEELVAAMARLQNPEHRNALGRSGYEAWEKKWTAEAHLEKYFDLISKVAARKRPGSEDLRRPALSEAKY
jgi:glycosyltransferase involved in cell wall biosynthesis